MCFQVEKAVDYMRACAFQTTRLADVCGLVKAGFEFDQRGDGLAIFRCFAERGDNGRTFGGTIERLFDRDHIRIAGCLG